MFHINTKEKTLNKKVKGMVKLNFPKMVAAKKIHVPGIGYTHFIINKDQKTIGQVYKLKGSMRITVK